MFGSNGVLSCPLVPILLCLVCSCVGRDDVCVRWEGDPSFDEVMVGFIEEVGSV